ncbi:UNVERIFIED_CONTAM: hypothetical protein N8J90_00985 [Halobacillus marinus]|uniref:hypothetical protein n=1 Tax=Bacillaceae TaxID=186817 RepID=UPI000406C9F3|nr:MULTISPECIES: hypothetical protein [Bacillaceae]QHT46344.1 hypothetical protein M662_07495 [Bacillus sp. SB49]
MLKKSLFFSVLVLFLLAACSEAEGTEPWKAAVIGKLPDFSDETVDFSSYSLKEWTEDGSLSDQYDALFVMPDQFAEASQDKYVSMFKESSVPVVFVKSEKRHLPFVTEGMDYEATPDAAKADYFATIYEWTGGEENREDVWYIEDTEDDSANYQHLLEKLASIQ